MDAKDFAVNQDGSFTVSLDGKPVKLVKESDLLAVKGGAESKEAGYLTQLANANGEKGTAHAKWLEAQAAKEAVEAKLKELEPFKLQYEEAGKKLTAAEAGSKQLRDRLLGIMKTTLMSQYGVKEDLLKDKALEDLEKLSEAAKILVTGSKGNGKTPANFDAAGGNGGAGGAGNTLTNPRERIKSGFDVLHPDGK